MTNKTIINNKNLRKIMTTKKHDEVNVIRSLSKKKSIKIDSITKTILIERNTTEVGNGSWGKIDYLVKVHGYIYVFANKINNNKPVLKSINQNNDFVNNKVAKRETKLNMAALSKAAMKKAKYK